MIFWWAKACPGLYYARTGPKGSDRTVAAKVMRRDDGSYEVVIYLPGHERTTRHFTNPKGARARAEGLIRDAVRGVHFANENFK